MPVFKDWKNDDKPRERFMQHGPAAVTDAELMAILIGNGTIGVSAVELCQEVLSKVDGLVHLGNLNTEELVQLGVKGLGPAKAVTLLAALELGNRRNLELDTRQLYKITKPQDAANYLFKRLRHAQQEVFVALFLNTACNVIAHHVIATGGIAAVTVDVRILMRKALSHNAAQILVCHNHPSGDLEPSDLDKTLTRQIAGAAQFFNMTLSDHIIVGTEGYFSFYQKGLLGR